MLQPTLAGTGFERHREMTRRERFLQEMDRIVPWQRLVDVVAPYYPTGERGRPPVGLERMLRVYCLGHWYNLSNPALEEALYDIEAMRRFVGIDLGREAAPDETTEDDCWWRACSVSIERINAGNEPATAAENDSAEPSSGFTPR